VKGGEKKNQRGRSIQTYEGFREYYERETGFRGYRGEKDGASSPSMHEGFVFPGITKNKKSNCLEGRIGSGCAFGMLTTKRRAL